MRNLILAFMNQELNTILTGEEMDWLDKVQFERMSVNEDKQFYNVVDGEEGDYGFIRYTNGEQKYDLAAYVNEGGDYEYWIFTDYFVAMCSGIVKELMEKRVNKVYVNAPDSVVEFDDILKKLCNKLEMEFK